MSKSKTSNKSGSQRPEGMLIVLSAPSGCGKTTVVERLLKRHPDWVRSISTTTRSPRSGEKDGEDYFFVDRPTFEKMRSRGELLESAMIFNHAYGTSRNFVLDSLKEGKRVILAIDVQGTRDVKQGLGGKVDLVTIFLLPPSVKVLRDRLEGRRTESPEEIDRRIERAQDEIKEASFYDHTVINQNLEETIFAIENLIQRFDNERRNSQHGVRTARKTR